MKKLAILLIALFMPLAAGSIAAAQGFDPYKGVCDSQTANSPVCDPSDVPPTKTDNVLIGPNGIITKAIRLLAVAVGVASVIIIMYGGLRYIMSGGDSAKVNKAKDTVLYAVIGVLVAVSAQMIVIFVLNRF